MRRLWVRTAVAAALTTGLAAVVALPRARSAEVPGPDPIVLMALPNGSEETPANTSRGTAIGRFVLTADRKRLIYEVRVSNLSSDATLMHLHRAPRGTPGPVLIPLDTPVRQRCRFR